MIEITGYRNEHKTQEDFINKPSVIGFAGFWTNRLYNKDVPNLFIWANALGHMDAAERALKRKDIATAFSYILQARRYYLVALKQYLTWREGIQGARVKMKGAILKASVLAIAAFVTPAVIARLALAIPEAATSTAAAEQTMAKAINVIEQADSVFMAEAFTEGYTEAELMEGAETEVEMDLAKSLRSF